MGWPLNVRLGCPNPLWLLPPSGRHQSSVGAGTHFTNHFLLKIQIRWKIRITVFHLLAIRLQQIFVHVTIAQLSRHLQNFGAIILLEWNKISIKLELWWKNCWWNRPLGNVWSTWQEGITHAPLEQGCQINHTEWQAIKDDSCLAGGGLRPVESTQSLYIARLVQERCNSSVLAMELRLFCTNPWRLVQERCNSSALAMELHLSCTNPWIYIDGLALWYFQPVSMFPNPVESTQSLYINRLVQERCNSSALAMELHLDGLVTYWWLSVRLGYFQPVSTWCLTYHNLVLHQW